MRSSLYRYYRYTRGEGKAMVHASVVLAAADQLRQRVAWALAQVYVVGESGFQTAVPRQGLEPRSLPPRLH